CSLVTAKKCLQNERVNLLTGLYFFGCSGTSAHGIRCNVGADEPTGERSQRQVVDCSWLIVLQGSRNRGQIDLICDPEVLQALADTPGTLWGLRVELNVVESSCNMLGPPVRVF